MTPNWTLLLDEKALEALLPGEYARFARPVRDALAVFLQGLPQADQARILRAQAALPAAAPFSQRLGVLAQSSPVLQKLGQILARDQRLSPELRRHLSALESLPPTVSFETIQELLVEQLGPLERRGVQLLPPAIAEASVAVVIPYRQEGHARQGVFKILKPGIEDRLARELALLEQVGEHLDQRCAELHIPSLDYQQAFEQVGGKLWEEVQLDHEQRHLVEAKAFFADEPRVRIPELYEHSTARVTAMERIRGGKVTAHGLRNRSQKRKLAALVAEALIAKPIFTKSDPALFHSDPHAGNLFLADDGCLAILDWSLAGRLREQERVAVVQLMLGAVTLDTRRIVEVLESLAGPRRIDAGATMRVVQRRLRRIRRGQFPGFSWLMGLLDEAAQDAGLRVNADLLLFRKSLYTLEGVVADVGEDRGQIDNVLTRQFLRHFVSEWPSRWLHLPNSRDFATRLSNADLTRAMLSYPATATRFWTGHAGDALEACVRRCKTVSPTAVEQEQACPSNR